MEPSLRALADDLLALKESESLLVVTGAGVSLASGIPTFRGSDPDAVWSNDTTRLGTNQYFRADPVGSWTWYLSRFEKLLGAQPNAAHEALVELEAWHEKRGRGFLLVTQNIDGLHRAAGSKNLVEIHGRADRVRCARERCELGAPRGSIPRDQVDMAAFVASPSKETLPRCAICDDFLRQHVLWFDEVYTMHEDYQFHRALDAAARAKVVLFAGTSFAVGITELVLEEAAAHRARVYSIDPTPRDAGAQVVPIVAAGEVALPSLMKMLAV